MERVRRLIESLLHRCPTIKAIGFTGQMHGIVYMDKDGRLLSPLYTWEDNRAGAVYGDVDTTSCEWTLEKSGIAYLRDTDLRRILTCSGTAK